MDHKEENMQTKLIAVVTLAAFLVSCAPSQAPVNIQGPVDTAVAQTMEIRDLVDTMVAQTVAAQIPPSTPTAAFTSTIAVIPSETPTIVLLLLESDTPLPSETPVPSNTSPPSDTPTVTRTPALYSCGVVLHKPGYKAEIKAGANFDIRWVIINTGTRTWPAGLDVKFRSGTQMTTVTVKEINKEMKPKDTFEINLGATAPTKAGLHEMIWVVEGGLCFPSMSIIVV
jgi:hypothetical protein